MLVDIHAEKFRCFLSHQIRSYTRRRLEGLAIGINLILPHVLTHRIDHHARHGTDTTSIEMGYSLIEGKFAAHSLPFFAFNCRFVEIRTQSCKLVFHRLARLGQCLRRHCRCLIHKFTSVHLSPFLQLN